MLICRDQYYSPAPGRSSILIDGDSWTDESLAVWTFPLFSELLDSPSRSVSSQGVGSQGLGDAATRIEALTLTGVDQVIVLAGVNNIKGGHPSFTVPVAVTGMQNAATRIINHTASTSTPLVMFTSQPFGNFAGFGNNTEWTAAKEAGRQQYNAWLLAQSGTNGLTVVDLDAIVDLDDDDAIDSAFDYGDGIHLNAAGNQAVADYLINNGIV